MTTPITACYVFLTDMSVYRTTPSSGKEGNLETIGDDVDGVGVSETPGQWVERCILGVDCVRFCRFNINIRISVL